MKAARAGQVLFSRITILIYGLTLIPFILFYCLPEPEHKKSGSFRISVGKMVEIGYVLENQKLLTRLGMESRAIKNGVLAPELIL